MLFKATCPSSPVHWRMFCASLLLLALLGCSSWKHGSHWSDGGKPPLIHATGLIAVAELPAGSVSNQTSRRARQHYNRAEALAAQGSARCVDEFYAAALMSWAEYSTSHQQPHFSDRELASALGLYHDSVARLIREGQAFGRLDPRSGLIVEDGHGRRM